jgi:hypothetical protein
MPAMLNRRQFVSALSWAGAASLMTSPRAFAAEGPLETVSVRITKNQGICYAPQYVAEALLRDEGFTDIGFVDTTPDEIPTAIALGKVDFGMGYAPQFARDIDAGAPITVIAGVMVGCVELFAQGIRSITDLNGKRVGPAERLPLPPLKSGRWAARAGKFCELFLSCGRCLSSPMARRWRRPPHYPPRPSPHQIPIDVNRQPGGPRVPSWGLSDAGLQRARPATMGRHPKPFTKAEVPQDDFTRVVDLRF